jgi:hypothetical protein
MKPPILLNRALQISVVAAQRIYNALLVQGSGVGVHNESAQLK